MVIYNQHPHYRCFITNGPFFCPSIGWVSYIKQHITTVKFITQLFYQVSNPPGPPLFLTPAIRRFFNFERPGGPPECRHGYLRGQRRVHPNRRRGASGQRQKAVRRFFGRWVVGDVTDFFTKIEDEKPWKILKHAKYNTIYNLSRASISWKSLESWSCSKP